MQELVTPSPPGGVELAWLWEARPKEEVPPGPLRRHAQALAQVLLPDALKPRPRPCKSPGPTSTATTRTRTPALSSRGPSRASPSPRRTVPSSTPDAARWEDGGRSSAASPVKPRRLGGGAHLGPSRMTLIQANMVPEQVAVWRGRGLQKALADCKQQAFEFAKYRLESAQERKLADRENAKRWTARVVAAKAFQEDHQPSKDLGLRRSLFHQQTTESIFRQSETGESSSSATDDGVEVPPPELPDRGRRRFTGVAVPLRTTETSGSPSRSGSATSEMPQASRREEWNRRNSLALAMIPTAQSGRRKSALTASARPTSTEGGHRRRRSSVSDAGSLPLSHRPSRMRPPELEHVVEVADEAPTPSGSKECVESKGKSKKHRGLTKLARVKRLLEMRKLEFEKLPLQQRERIQKAFDAGRERDATLTYAGLRVALVELGLQPRTTNERDAVNTLLREASAAGGVNFFDFAFQVISKVEAKLRQLRSPELHSQFTALDTQNSGSLGKDACLEALKRFLEATSSTVDDEMNKLFMKNFVEHEFWKFFEVKCTKCDGPTKLEDHDDKDCAVCQTTGTRLSCQSESCDSHFCEEHSKAHPEVKNGLADFVVFEEIAATYEAKKAAFLREGEAKIARDQNLPPMLEATHAGELGYFYRVYEKLASAGYLSINKMIMVLVDCGVLPIVGELFNRFREELALKEDLTLFKFMDMLNYIARLRAEESAARKVALQALFQHHSWHPARIVTAAEVPMLMVQLGICTDSCYKVQDVIAHVEECNKEGAELFPMTDLLALMGKAAERARAHARAREAVVANEVGFKPAELFDLRIGFAALTLSGVVGHSEIRRFLQVLNPTIQIKEKDVVDLIQEVNGNEGPQDMPSQEVVRFNDTGGLSEVIGIARPQNMPKPSAPLTLRFDGYIRLVAKIMQ